MVKSKSGKGKQGNPTYQELSSSGVDLRRTISTKVLGKPKSKMSKSTPRKA